MSRKPKGHTQKLKAWTPTRRQLIEELGTASDRDLGLKYSLSAGRVRGLRLENGIASYTKNKKRTPMSDLQEKVQSLEDEVIRLRAYVKHERERSRNEAERIVAASSRWIDMAPKLLAMKDKLMATVRAEVQMEAKILREILVKEVARKIHEARVEYEETNRAKGQNLFELPGYMYQDFKMGGSHD
jgi:hypothetical protein